MGAGDLTEPVSVRARFERFPATLKGAFILRGEDQDPHQVVFRGGRIVGIGLGSSLPMPMGEATLDVAPHRDLFIPFEVSVGDLGPGWYTLICDLDVDGFPATLDGGRRFSVPWPRSSVRRGQVKVQRGVSVGAAKVVVEQLDCGGDSLKVHLVVDPPGPISARLSADGDRLEVLETEVDPVSGRGRVTAYPVLRVHGVLRIALRGPTRGAEGTLEVDLPT